jgi:hypothetical protein
MYEFIFKIDDDVIYRSFLKSIQCIDHTKAHTQCKRQTVIGLPYCYTHFLYKHHLRIKKSTIPNAGMGIFAVDPTDSSQKIIFKPNDTIALYKGEIIDKDILIERYAGKTPPYVVGINKNRYEDGARYRGVGSIANTKAGHNNATISVHNKYAKIKATKNIYNGDEVFLSYGKSHKLNELTVSQSTKKVK